MRRNPLGDPARLDALHATGLLDSAAEEAFDRFTRLATAILDAPVALVSLVDADRQFFKSCVGLPEPSASARQTPLSHSFCQHAVTSRDLVLRHRLPAEAVARPRNRDRPRSRGGGYERDRAARPDAGRPA